MKLSLQWKKRAAAIRRRREQHALDEAEYGGRGADAERERQDRDRAECRLLLQHSDGKPQIVNHRALSL